jgi:CPA1 family monovalent cation:H+ antiporter
VRFETLFLILFTIATAVALAARWLKIPYTVALVVSGLALGMTHVIETPHLTRQLLYSLILPGLLFEASFHLDLQDLWKNRLAVPMLAVPGVLASILLTAFILTLFSSVLPLLHDFTLPQGLVFGAVIAATDPIAVVAVFRSLGAPKRLRVLVEGESLLNDGTALVLYGLVLTFVSGTHVAASSLVVEFFKVVGTGVMAGIAAGTLVSKIIGAVDDPMIEITLTTIAAYGSFVAGDAIGGSGVIATVTAGMLCGNYGVRKRMSPSTRIATETFWEYVAFALNSVVFLLIGFELRASDLIASWQPILAAYLAVTVGRSLIIGAVTGILQKTRERIPWNWAPVLTWSGLRGALSMVLALSLAPEFPQRHLIVTMTFGVVLLTILIQGTTMKPLLKRSGLVSQSLHRRDFEVARGRTLAARAALSEIDRMRKDLAIRPSVLDTLRERYDSNIREAEGAVRRIDSETQSLRVDETREVRRHLLATERSALIQAVQEGVLGEEAFQSLAAEVDARIVRLDEGDDEQEPAKRTDEKTASR